MRRLHATNTVDQEEVAHIAFFNLALHAARPYLVFTHQPVQQPVVALADCARRKLFDAPLVLQADAHVFKFLVRRQVARLVWVSSTSAPMMWSISFSTVTMRFF